MSERRIFSRLEPSCLYPDDKELGALILGPKRAHMWPEIVKLEERHGFPRVDPLYGGREWHAVIAFYEHRRRSLPEAVTSFSMATDERRFENWDYSKSLAQKKADRAAAKAATEAAEAEKKAQRERTKQEGQT